MIHVVEKDWKSVVNIPDKFIHSLGGNVSINSATRKDWGLY